MIRWTRNKEVVQLPAEQGEILEAQGEAIKAQFDLRDLKAYRLQFTRLMDTAEHELTIRLGNALDRVRSKMTSRLARVGYDLEAGDVVLADPKTNTELLRRPMNEAERLIARQLPGEP